MSDYQRQIERCDREIAAALAYDGPDKYGATWCEMDWLTEKWILTQEREQSNPSKPQSATSACADGSTASADTCGSKPASANGCGCPMEMC